MVDGAGDVLERKILEPDPGLIKSLGMHHSLESAVADLIDNSLDAGANRVLIIFETEDSLRQLWASPRRIFLLTYNPIARTSALIPYGAVHTLAAAGGKTILTNH